MNTLANGNVTQLEHYRRYSAKQISIREGYRSVFEGSPSTVPVAVCGVTVHPDGSIHSVIREVEPEQVPGMLSAMMRLVYKLEIHYADALKRASAA